MVSFTANKFKYIEELDDVSLFVQECSGYFEVQRHVVEFFVPAEYQEFILLKYPFLTPEDYIL